MKERINLSVVIPTMNRIDTLKETLDSYLCGEIIPDQIVIIDQTTDEKLKVQMQKLIEQYRSKYVIDYFYQEDASLTKARNKGLGMCKNDVVIFSDDDITVQSNTIKNVLEIMSDSNIALIAGINSRDGYSASVSGYVFGKKSYSKRKIGHVTDAMYGRFPSQKVVGTVKTEWAMGFFFVVRKQLVERWNNYWDEKLTSYAYAEDLDFSYSYCKKAQKNGLRCIIDERIVVEHRVSNEWRVPTRKSTMMLVLNREYLSYKHQMGIKSRVMTRWSNFGELLFRVIKKSKPNDLIAAQIICDRHRKELSAGIIKSDWYE